MFFNYASYINLKCELESHNPDGIHHINKSGVKYIIKHSYMPLFCVYPKLSY